MTQWTQALLPRESAWLVERLAYKSRQTPVKQEPKMESALADYTAICIKQIFLPSAVII